MKKLLLNILCFVLFTMIVACKKTLNALPENAKVDANTILDQRTAEVALRGAYYLFSAIPASGRNITYWTNHEWLPGYYAGYIAGTPDGPEEENRYVDGFSRSAVWDESYGTINAANGIINRIPLLPDAAFTDDRKNGILGEALFLRAYSHFRILSYYGEWFKYESPYGILVRNELSNLDNIAKARTSVKESYDFIISDLDKSISTAPIQNPNYYATRWAAMALKMRVLMSRGQAGDYAAVISLADQIIQNSPYQLEANPRDIFRTKGLSSSEVILGVRPQPNQQNDVFNISISYSSFTAQVSVGHYATKRLYDLFRSDDPRKNWVVGAPLNVVARPNAYFFTKYITPNTTPTVASETSYAFRLSEIYLLKAEAISRSRGDLNAAKTILKNSMQRAGATDFSMVDNANSYEAFELQLFYEISRSLIAEDGQEWMALLRLPFITVKQLKPTITNMSQYILPIPAQEFLTNPTIGEQNPGYSKM
ncbi:RagB/SusD family nutrient uptake outer membrane protein [Pedobacter sp. MC2016-14]|uniref:RagB/SusD family nutrient uptake outer membrane protein n=1 Tax=Pedobacter sp. MC2016-14 TaxID=2897327 RepID=UPI001E536784|nr:RagB/SusD family nutrient uptake outer membrane protein [Pedobacter sp. MC2016-14]MCD0490423.1 RagB/SusD family nutrient uptake outer membrane protein [Pedobacter sp. MC2016-14]